MYRIALTDEQYQGLIQLTHQKGVPPRTRLRLEMVRLNHAGFRVPEIAQLLGQHESTVRHWLRAFVSDGFVGLNDKEHPGRASALTADILESMRQAIGKAERTWTARQVAQWVDQHYGVQVSHHQMRIHLRRHHLSYQRTSLTVKHKQKPEEVQSKKTSLQILEKGGTPG